MFYRNLIFIIPFFHYYFCAKGELKLNIQFALRCERLFIRLRHTSYGYFKKKNPNLLTDDRKG